ncbi:MAG: RsmF rRNA methyltransferase first C-terminal domain-containing protein [Clostridiales bacterium]|nr:RsmF rRNA methyltransferase first C-terminal domain-containing protein [Clostridiales bacterium]
MHRYFTEKGRSEEEALFLASYEEPAFHGIRWNRLKMTGSEYASYMDKLGLSVDAVPWCDGGFYTPEISLGKDPYYHAGAYYIQEPSAMLPASVLGTKPGEFVLDMCAAPGGKATRIAEDLRGEGLLVANEINAERSRALLRNLERAGAANVVILNEDPVRMVKNFKSFFDRIIIDAPCSGEGMFRRDPFAPKSWVRFGPKNCVPLQSQILECADEMLAPGGELVYSTCTFGEAENEEQIHAFLASHEGYEIIAHRDLPGVSCDEEGMMRIWPHKTRGEGHFCVHLRKAPGPDAHADSDIKTGVSGGPSAPDRRRIEKNPSSSNFTFVKSRECFTSFIKGLLTDEAGEEYEKTIKTDFVLHKDKVHMMPVSEVLFHGLKVVKMGDFPGEIKETAKGRVFVPSQALALELPKEKIRASRFLSLPRDDERLLRYLRCETIMLTDEEQGILDAGEWVIVACEELPLGFGKVSGGTIKNAYPKAWRLV